jgi:protein-disulfide isomerase
MNKRVIFIIISIIVAVAGFLYLTRPAAEEAKAEPSNHVIDGNSGVVFVEYGDFQCPACGAYHPILKEAKAKYAGVVTFQFRHFPLESLHKNARAASRAAEAAGNQGKFWEMHDALFENQQAWQDTTDPVSLFESYAEQVGVSDLAKFSEDYKSSAVNDVINADLAEGRALGATATPTFVLNGKKLDENPSSPEALYKLLDDAIAEKTGTPAPESTVPEDTTTPETPAQ